MQERTLACLMAFKIACCVGLLIFFLGGFGFLAGLGSGSLLLAGLGLLALMLGFWLWMKRGKACSRK